MSCFMKKITVLLLFIFLALPAISKQKAEKPTPPEEPSMTIKAGVSFDWITKTQLQRDENIKQIQNILFTEEIGQNYSKKEFKEKYKDEFKDKNNFQNYTDVSAGKREDQNNFYCGFYRDKLLVAYGIQHKADLNTVYYYDALGNLRWVEIFGGKYPAFPSWSYQYYRNGKLVAAFYNLSEYDQYLFNEKKQFIGRAYKENIYNRNAKVIMTRTNYWDRQD